MGIFNKNNTLYKISCPIEPNHNKEWLAVKYPANEFTVGSLIEVPPGTVAIAVHGGKIEHVFQNGTAVLNVENFPFIQYHVKKLFKGATPFTMDIYYLNATAEHEFKWGTTSAITVESAEEADMGITYNCGAYGSYFLRIKHYQFFYQWILGSLAYGEFVYWNNVSDKLRTFISSQVTTYLSDYINNNRIGYGRIQSIGTTCANEIGQKMTDLAEEKFGLEFLNLTVTISIDQKDRDRLNKAREEAQRAAQQGRLNDVAYARGVQQRQLDVMKDAANNQGTTGGLMGAGIGLGAGLSMMGQANNVAQQNPNPTAYGGQTTYGNNQGIPNQQQPISKKCSNCGKDISAGAAFCPSCGTKAPEDGGFCPYCGTPLIAGAAFCSKCGKKVG